MNFFPGNPFCNFLFLGGGWHLQFFPLGEAPPPFFPRSVDKSFPLYIHIKRLPKSSPLARRGLIFISWSFLQYTINNDHSLET